MLIAGAHACRRGVPCCSTQPHFPTHPPRICEVRTDLEYCDSDVKGKRAVLEMRTGRGESESATLHSGIIALGEGDAEAPGYLAQNTSDCRVLCALQTRHGRDIRRHKDIKI